MAFFKAFWGPQDQQDVQASPWHQSPGSFPPSPSIPSTPNTVSSLSSVQQKPSDHAPSPSYGQVSPAEAASIIALLKDKSVDELRKILNDKNAYNAILQSIEQVKIQTNLRNELQEQTVQLARTLSLCVCMCVCLRASELPFLTCVHGTLSWVSIYNNETGENLEKEPRILELMNQCRIIRTTELAAAQEQLNHLEKEKEETLRLYAPSTLVQRLQDAMASADEESEKLHDQFLAGEIDLQTFLNKYKKLRTTYHRRALIHLAVKTSF